MGRLPSNVVDRNELERRLAKRDRLLREYSGSADPVAVGRVAVALTDKARILGDLGRNGDALELWEEVLERYAQDPPSGEELIALEAGYGKTRELAELERTVEALGAADEVLARWGPRSDGEDEELSEADETQRSRYVAATLLVKHRLCSERHRVEEVLSISAELIARYGESADPYLTVAVAHALRSDVYWLLACGRVEEAIAASERLSARFAAEEDRDMLLRVGDPLFQAGCSLGTIIAAEQGVEARAVVLLTALACALHLLEQDRSLWPRGLWRQMSARRRRAAQAERIFELVIEHVRDLDDPDLAHLAAQARIHLSVVQMLSGRFGLSVSTMDAAWTMGEPAVRIFRTMADHAIAGDGRGAAWEASTALFVLGAVHEAIGQRPEAAAAYTECIERYRRSRSPLVIANVLLARLSRRTVRAGRSRPAL
jgi:tetratricopeptide (TPR) repeat protein